MGGVSRFGVAGDLVVNVFPAIKQYRHFFSWGCSHAWILKCCLMLESHDELYFSFVSKPPCSPVTSRFRFTDDTIWGMRDRSEDEKFRDKPYYGIKGLKRLSNGPVAVFCLLFMALGIFVHVTAIR